MIRTSVLQSSLPTTGRIPHISHFLRLLVEAIQGLLSDVLSLGPILLMSSLTLADLFWLVVLALAGPLPPFDRLLVIPWHSRCYMKVFSE